MKFYKSRKMMILLGLVALVSGCVTTEQVNGQLQPWIGRDADELASRWGAPNGNYQKKDGGRILTYDRSVVRSVGSIDEPRAETSSCKITFVTDQSNKITSFDWRGSNQECVEMIPQ